MADVYMKAYTEKICSDSYVITSNKQLLQDVNDLRLKSFRITAGRIFKNAGTTVLDEMVESSFYISYSEEYCSWRTTDRSSDLARDDYIICTRNWIASRYKDLTQSQLSRIPEQFVITEYGCIVGQKYTNSSGLRGFEIYDLEKATAFMHDLVYSITARDRVNLVWPEPEVF